MADASRAAYRERYSALRDRLAAPEAVRELDVLKTEIGTLFKQLEQELGELTAVRDEVKRLVEQWKLVKGAASSAGVGSNGAAANGAGANAAAASAITSAAAPQFSPERPVVHADHLGASTFIEKGWSKLSLADYPGAEAALRKALTLSPNDPQSQALLGWALMLQEKYDDALMEFQKVLMRQPQNSLARINVGYIC
jgi:tetratricopeptide (TPR) repeat protein